MESTDGTGDVARPPGEDAWFCARVSELEGAIRRVVTQEADDLCWMDVYTQLAALVGIAFDPRMIPRDHMLANCERFVDSLIGGCPYAVDATTAELARLRARVEELEAERDEYASTALAGLGGIVGTPEKGYVRDGGPGLLRDDFRRLRRRIVELEAERDDLLVLLRDRAIDDHRAGLTEPMDDWLDPDPDEPDPATLARAAGLGDGFDETAPDPALAGWADDDWGARP